MDVCGGQDTGLYAQLLAGVAGTAVRVSVGHWCSHPETPFAEVFHEVFDQLAAYSPRRSHRPGPAGEAAARARLPRLTRPDLFPPHSRPRRRRRRPESYGEPPVPVRTAVPPPPDGSARPAPATARSTR
ncbi:hypothetical protein ACFQVA_33875 [Actinomadura keratinilytica]